jgi:hypothetical protein
MALGDSEDSFPTAKAPKGILSDTTLPVTGMGEYGEQMAPDEDDHSDTETVHAQTMMDALKAGDTKAFRDANAAFVRECIRNYGKGKAGEIGE